MTSVLKRNIEELRSLLAQAESLETKVTAAADALAHALARGSKLLACGKRYDDADCVVCGGGRQKLNKKDRIKRSFNAWIALLVAIMLPGTLLMTSQASAQGPQQITPAMDEKIEAMLSRLSLEEKIALLGGADGMAIRSEPSIGMPALRMSDGPMGVKSWGPSSAYPAGISLAATWDTSLARQIGVVLGEDARARGVSFLLGPGVNLYRASMNGRNFEYFGEDPFLAGQIAVGYIQGVQSQGVVATVKHYVANNSEYDRHRINAVIDERTLRELYLPAFEAAVKQGQVGAVMDSYNLINGEYATQNSFLNNQVLRKEWGFNGILMSDWGATYDGVAAANGGLDLEMGNAEFMNAATLLPALRNGRVSKEVIDEKVRRILRTAVRFHFFEREQAEPSIPLFNQEGRKMALQAAEEGAVLLKNEASLLPLDANRIHSLAVLGPNAYPAVPGGGGSSQVTAIAPVSLMTGISNALDSRGVKVYWDSGIKTPLSIFSETEWCADSACKATGLSRNEFIDKTGVKTATGTDDRLDSTEHPGGDDWNPGYRRVEWGAYYLPKTSGTYRVVAATVGEDSYKLLIDDRKILEVPQHQNGQAAQSALLTLQGGTPIRIKFVYWPMTEQKTAGLGLIREDQLLNPEAIRLARMADVAVVAVGYGPSTEGEGLDRTYQLPFGQQELLQAIAAANPHTIAVLSSGGSVETQGWIEKVPVLLQSWYGGQESGRALSRILFGEVNPTGKLPVSWEKRLADNPAANNYYEAPGSRDVRYAEGVFLGYRFYDKNKVEPLFPFGFGLSYTTFAFSNLKIAPDDIPASDSVTVDFDVKNTGQRAGAEIAQVYVGDPSATVPRAERELKGFSRVMLEPGESKHILVKLDRRSLAYWDIETHDWKVDPGRFVVCVGDSSRNLPLQASFNVR